MIPICLVTGFLGCGKTTFLKKTIEREHNRRIVYLVNEFASIDIDGELLKNGFQNVVTVPGGSIFCKCLIGEFIRNMNLIARKYYTGDVPVDGVLIEASGMANPSVIMDMLHDTKLDKVYRLARVMSVVDPRSLLVLINILPNIRAQIEASDTVLLNKTDIYSEEQVCKAKELILSINRTADVVNTQFCNAEVELFPQADLKQIHGEYAKCKDPLYSTYTCIIPGIIQIEQFKDKLLEFKDEIYRVKGFVCNTDGKFFIDFSHSGLSLTHVADDKIIQSALAFIVKGNASDNLLIYIDNLRNGNDL